jgi:hypothetical protein
MAQKKTLELDIETKQAQAGVQDIVDSIGTLGDKIQDTTKDVEKMNKTVEAPAKKGIFKKLSGGVTGLAKGFGGLVKSAGIFGIITLAVGKLVDLLKGSQTVVDAFAVGFEAIELVFSQLSKTLKDVYENIAKTTENFDALGKVMSGILTIAITPIKLGFQGIKASITGAQLAWEKSWFGGNDPERIKELQAELSEIGDSVIEIGTDAVQAGSDIVDNFGEAITEVGDIGSKVVEEVSKINVKSIIDTAKANVEFEKQAKISQARNAGILAEFEQQAEMQRQIRDNTSLDLKTRIEANDKIVGIYAQQRKLLLKNAQIQIDLAQGEVDKAEDNVEAQINLINAQNEYKAVLESVNAKLSEFKTNETTLRKENIDMINSEKEANNARVIDAKRFDAELIEDELEKLEKLKEIDAEEQELETARLQNVIDLAKEGTQAKIDAQIAYDDFLEQSRQKNKTRDKEIADEKVRIEKEKYDEFYDAFKDFGKKMLEQGKRIEQKRADAKEAIQKNSLIAMSNLIEAFANQNEKNAERAFNLQKGLAIVETLINTSVAIMKVARDTKDPIGPLRLANMIAMGVAGATQVAAIASRKFNPSGATGDRSVPTSSGGASTSPTEPPSFNVVGQSGFNQIAGALGQQPPAQAYVVAGDVTTAQQLQNNTIQQATF